MPSISKPKQQFVLQSHGGFNRLDDYLLNAIPDELDLRDYPYEPALIQLKKEISPPTARTVLNQGKEGACTGFGLAAVINQLLKERGEARTVSARMLYEVAKKFDKWKGEDYSGSSCRGAVRGWNNMGVCSASVAPYKSGQKNWKLTIEMAKDARNTTLGAYYRVSKRISDYHAALNEVGILYASARVHTGWERSQIENGEIRHDSDSLGGHAFAIVGYNNKGFYVQNSWGNKWGDNGVALWRYEDWLENVRDAWVVRLALSTPQIWHLGPSLGKNVEPAEGLFSRKPKWAEIEGHFVHIDDGQFHDDEPYPSNLTSVQQTAELVAKSDRYDHLLFYAHGGLNNVKASARRIVAMKEVFKKNRIYPFHFMYDTGLLEEMKDVVSRKKSVIDERTRGPSDIIDPLIEKAVRPLGRAVWNEMKQGATSPFELKNAGSQTINAFLRAFTRHSTKKIHIVGHSTGAILHAALLKMLSRKKEPPFIHTCSLMAPACTIELFEEGYCPYLVDESTSLQINKLVIYNLDDSLELGDRVTRAYNKSLLYLVSNSFEEKTGAPILGMQKFKQDVPTTLPKLKVEVSTGVENAGTKTASKTHGGFDNDPSTMNSILHTILNDTPEHPFTKDDLNY
ncbi:MAG: C1 family peptidase [Gammaproteobacteria bacterium]|nr:C1 family peptidase [Gammaproteobacteria bacterium]